MDILPAANFDLSTFCGSLQAPACLESQDLFALYPHSNSLGQDGSLFSDNGALYENQFDPCIAVLEQILTSEPSNTANCQRDNPPSHSQLEDTRSCGPSDKEAPKQESNAGKVQNGGARKRQRRRWSKRGILTADEAEERRQHYLQRNRVAANKCRRKRNEHITSLQEQEAALEKLNENMKSELALVKDEVAELKLLVMIHSTCTLSSEPCNNPP